MSVEVVTVNYNTPDLIEKLIKSVRYVEGNYQIRVIDGSDREPFKSKIKEVCAKFYNVILQQQGWNIHHGRGMDLAVSTSTFEWCLVIDSDNYLKLPIIDKMLGCQKKIVGGFCYVNNRGMNVSEGIKYYHPSLMLMNVGYYLELKKQGIGFIHHGAPCIRIMRYLHDNKLTDAVCCDIWASIEAGSVVSECTRGTRNRFGMNL